MPRFLVQRPAADRPEPIPEGVIWLHSYVTTDGLASFCLYDAPDIDAIPRGPSDSVAEVETRDPFTRTG
jgi:Protein of unknown function (DUF4242)